MRLAMILALTIITVSAPIEGQMPGKPAVKEQSLFGAEDQTFDRSVTVPGGALEVLRKDEKVLRYLNAEQKSPEDLTTDSFLAAEIHLDGPDEIDLVVMGEGRLLGANVATFWVFRKMTKSYQLVLKAVGHDLRIETTRWKGFRNISTGTPIAGYSVEVFYRFDGGQYQYFRTKSELIH